MKETINSQSNIFVSSDMEGIAGLMSFEEADKEHQSYQEFRQIMSNEVAEICNVLSEKGYLINVKDAHDDGKNILLDQLNENTTIVRGWNQDIKQACYGIDSNTKGAVLHGYHSAGGTKTSPIAHTINYETIEYIKLNGEIIGETTLSIYTCALFNIPVFFISGDRGAVLEAKRINSNIIGLATKKFDGNLVISKSPKKVILELREQLIASLETLKKDRARFVIILPKEFNFEIKFKEESHRLMDKLGIEIIDSKTIYYQTDNFQKFLELLQ